MIKRLTRSGRRPSRRTCRMGAPSKNAQQSAGHASPKTTKLYDRTADTVTVDVLWRTPAGSRLILMRGKSNPHDLGRQSLRRDLLAVHVGSCGRSRILLSRSGKLMPLLVVITRTRAGVNCRGPGPERGRLNRFRRRV